MGLPVGSVYRTVIFSPEATACSVPAAGMPVTDTTACRVLPPVLERLRVRGLFSSLETGISCRTSALSEAIFQVLPPARTDPAMPPPAVRA